MKGIEIGMLEQLLRPCRYLSGHESSGYHDGLMQTVAQMSRKLMNHFVCDAILLEDFLLMLAFNIFV